MSRTTPRTYQPANTQDLYERFANNAGVSMPEAKRLVDAFLGTVVELVDEFPYLQVRDFGNFEYRYRKEVVKKNALIGDTVTQPAYETLHFKCARGLQRKVDY